MQQNIFPEGYQDAPPVEQSRMPSLKLRRHLGALAAKECEIVVPTDKDIAMKNPESRALIANDGTKTFIVHSTDPETAKHIMNDGLIVPSVYGQSDKTLLSHTAVMLAGPEAGRRQTKENTFAMAYRYAGVDNSAKLVFAFDHENPGTSTQRTGEPATPDAFSGTFLEHADGQNVLSLDPDDETKAFLVPAQRAVGYLDLDTGEFVHNPNFGQPLQDAASTS